MQRNEKLYLSVSFFGFSSVNLRYVEYHSITGGIEHIENAVEDEKFVECKSSYINRENLTYHYGDKKFKVTGAHTEWNVKGTHMNFVYMVENAGLPYVSMDFYTNHLDKHKFYMVYDIPTGNIIGCRLITFQNNAIFIYDYYIDSTGD